MQKIVLVEDDDDIRRLHAQLLRHGGHCVIERESAAGLTELVQAEKPNLVLLDVSMPGENGISACRRIKSDPTIAHTRVVMLTAHDSFQAIRESSTAGADGHLVKPVKAAVLLGCVQPTVHKRPSYLKRALRTLQS